MRRWRFFHNKYYQVYYRDAQLLIACITSADLKERKIIYIVCRPIDYRLYINILGIYTTWRYLTYLVERNSSKLSFEWMP